MEQKKQKATTHALSSSHQQPKTGLSDHRVAPVAGEGGGIVMSNHVSAKSLHFRVECCVQEGGVRRVGVICVALCALEVEWGREFRVVVCLCLNAHTHRESMGHGEVQARHEQHRNTLEVCSCLLLLLFTHTKPTHSPQLIQVPAAAQQLTQVLSKLRHTFVVADATLPDCPLVYASES